MQLTLIRLERKRLLVRPVANSEGRKCMKIKIIQIINKNQIGSKKIYPMLFCNFAVVGLESTKFELAVFVVGVLIGKAGSPLWMKKIIKTAFSNKLSLKLYQTSDEDDSPLQQACAADF